MSLIDPELLENLVCPETHQPVRMADDPLIKKLNASQAEGKLLNRDGKPVAEKLDGGLVREDGAFLYPIHDGIPVLLIEEAIALETSGG